MARGTSSVAMRARLAPDHFDWTDVGPWFATRPWGFYACLATLVAACAVMARICWRAEQGGPSKRRDA